MWFQQEDRVYADKHLTLEYYKTTIVRQVIAEILHQYVPKSGGELTQTERNLKKKRELCVRNSDKFGSVSNPTFIPVNHPHSQRCRGMKLWWNGYFSKRDDHIWSNDNPQTI